jgi:Reverse transcriptase (RNA-dependent DNA polymerase)
MQITLCSFEGKKKEKIYILVVYVDDIVLTNNDLTEMKKIKASLATEFEIKDLGELRYFLGIEVTQSKKGVVLSQQKYVLDLLNET